MRGPEADLPSSVARASCQGQLPASGKMYYVIPSLLEKDRKSKELGDMHFICAIFHLLGY